MFSEKKTKAGGQHLVLKDCNQTQETPTSIPSAALLYFRQEARLPSHEGGLHPFCHHLLPLFSAPPARVDAERDFVLVNQTHFSRA